MRQLFVFGLVALGPGFTIHADVIAPCTAAPGVVNIIPLSNATNVYCVSDYGWSDAWFVGSAPTLYSAPLDVLSGDDSPNLHFGVLGGDPVASGFGWLTPVMDVGTLEPIVPTGSVWTVVVPVHASPTGVASQLHHPLGLEMFIDTSITPTGEIRQKFSIVNSSKATTFTDIRFADYFNFHPNGSTALNSLKGTIRYDPLSGLVVTGILDGTFIANGSMRGERPADAHACNAPIITWDIVQTNTYISPCPISPAFLGPGDVAGGLAWDLTPFLAPDASVDFTIFKQAAPLASPEVSTVWMLASALAAMGVLRLAGRK